MKSAIQLLAAVASGTGLIGPVFAVEPAQRVENFRLLDQQGRAYELHSLSERQLLQRTAD